MKIKILSILLFVSSFATAQLSPEEQRVVDSLINVVETTKSDTIKVRALNRWDDYVYIFDPALDFELNKRIEKICEDNLADEKLLDERSIFFFKVNYSTCLNILGLVYQDQGDYKTSINYHYKSLSVAEELIDSLALSRSYNNIGLLHALQKNNKEALLYYNKKVDIELRLGDEQSLALVYSNIGRLYYTMDSLELAYDYYQKSLEIRERLNNNENSLANSYNEIAMLHVKWEKLDSVLYYYTKSLDVYTKIGYVRGVSSVNSNLGEYYMKIKNYKKALFHLKAAYAIDTSTNNFVDLSTSTNVLYQLYYSLGDYENALEMYQLNREIEDSIFSIENSKAMFQKQFSYDYEKRVAADSIIMQNEKKVMDAELIAADAEVKRQEEQKYYFIGGLVLAIVFGLFILNRYRITQKQKRLIEKQKKQVDEQQIVLSNKNKELNYKNLQITDSIAYAKRIQKAVLPSKEEFSTNFSDSFIFYKPKDVVSGDFHWFAKTGDLLIFAVADCTGHGVPGAFMSIIGNNLLDNIVSVLGITQPDEVLNKLNKGKSFELADGMDIALCSINLKTNKMMFSGAHSPLYHVRSGKLEEHKGDRLHLGNLENTKGKNFSLVELDLQKGDTLFLFTDGYADQKGGVNGKKFFYQPFRQLLLDNNSQSMKVQKEILTNTMNDWKRDMPQLDDMLVMGVKI